MTRRGSGGGQLIGRGCGEQARYVMAGLEARRAESSGGGNVSKEARLRFMAARVGKGAGLKMSAMQSFEHNVVSAMMIRPYRLAVGGAGAIVDICGI